MASTLISPTTVDERTACRALASELPRELRELRVAVMRETLANGVPVSPAALTVVLSSLDDRAEEPLLFTAPDLEELLWFGLEQFCEELGMGLPSGCPAALHALLAAVVRLDLLADGSDRPRELFATLGALGAA